MGDLLFFKPGPRKPLRHATPAVDWYERGVALEATDPDAAIAAYERAVSGHGGHGGRSDLASDAYNNLGRIHHDRAKHAVAESCYRIALCVRPDVALYWFNLGVVVEDQGRSSEAIDAYERAIRLDATMADAHFNLSRQYEMTARRSGDELLLRRAVRHLVHYRSLTCTSSLGR